MKRDHLLFSVLTIATLTATLVLLYLNVSAVDSQPRVIEITAKRFTFEPSIIRVQAGEEVIFRLRSIDVTHGFYIDGYDYFVTVLPGETVEVGPIRFEESAKLKVRCSITCGPLHPFMVADIIVEPNYVLPAFALLTLSVFAASLFYIRREPVNKMLGISLDKEVDLLKIRGMGPVLKRLLQWRGIHFTLILPNLLIFMIILAAGFFGNPTGNKNFSIAVVWILWFAAVEFMILLAGRLWCTLCPLPAFGEWLARKRLYGVHNRRKWFSLEKKWPKRLNNMWISAFGFLGISLIVPWLVTRPVITGFLFLLLIVLGIIVHLVFTQRYFCRHVCPAGGYIGSHSNASIFAVRSRDKSVCDEHTAKECIKGSPKGYGCPWVLYPGGNDQNTYCGQCFECLKSCPLDNMTLKLRMIGRDIANLAAKAKNKFDEAWMEFIRFTLVMVYTLVFFGPYFSIKDWGNMGNIFGANLATIGLLTPTVEGLSKWFKWALLIGGVTLIGFPAVFYVFSWLAKKAAGDVEQTTKRLFLSFSYALAPYGLFLWLAFAITLVSVNWAYALTAFSDPLGWGWNLLGVKFKWRPLLPHLLPYVQVVMLLVGLALAINSTYNIARKLFDDHKKAFKASVVMGLFHVLAALVFVWIIAG